MKPKRRPEEDWIVGRDVPDQGRLRPVVPVSDLREFLDFLEDFEALFGIPEREPPTPPRAPFRL